jgi:hypothetical protein
MGSKLLLPVEEQEFLLQIASAWCIKQLGMSPDRPTQHTVHMDEFSFTYTDVKVARNKMTLTGGTHMDDGPVDNKPHTQEFHLMHDPDGALFLDHLGSKIFKHNVAEGEVVINSALGFRVLWQWESKANAQGQHQEPSSINTMSAQ